VSRTATSSRNARAFGRLRHVEVALDDDAEAAGAALLARGSNEAARMLEAARAEAARIVEEGRAEGAEVGARLVSATRAAARRAAREIVLSARDDAYELVRRRVLDELVRRKASDEVHELNRRLEGRAIGLLGPGTTIRRDPLGVGLVADAGRRRVDLSAARLVDSSLAALGQALERLWS
jgi:vacuolar-type H+-ATPase subunit H